MIKKAIMRSLAFILVLSMVFTTACGNKKADNKVQTSVDDDFDDGLDDDLATDEADKQKTDAFGIGDVTAEDIEKNESEEVIARLYPSEAAKEPLYEFVKEADESLLLEHEGKEGEPYFVEGTVIGISDMDKYIDVFGYTPDMELPDNIDFKKIKAFTVNAFGEDLVFIDYLSLDVDLIKEYYKDDLISLKALKCEYNNLKVYDDFPEIGEKVKMCGQYFCYSTTLGCHVFIYGLSSLVHQEVFGLEYDKYHSTATSHYKYKNYYEIDYPAAWGKVDESGETGTAYTYNGSVVCDYFDALEEDDLKANIEGYKEMWGLDQEFITLLREEYTDLPCGKQCYRAGFNYIYSEDGAVTLYVAAFEHKHKLMVLWYYDYLSNDYSDLYLNDFWSIVASVTPCGI